MNEDERRAEVGEQRKLGLDRLSPRAIYLLGSFINEWVERLQPGLVEELKRLPERNVQAAYVVIEELSTGEVEIDRYRAAELVPYLAQSDPERGFEIWKKLMSDPSIDVWEAASDALSETLGVLDLDIERVVELIEVHYEAIRLRNRRSGPTSET